MWWKWDHLVPSPFLQRCSDIPFSLDIIRSHWDTTNTAAEYSADHKSLIVPFLFCNCTAEKLPGMSSYRATKFELNITSNSYFLHKILGEVLFIFNWLNSQGHQILDKVASKNDNSRERLENLCITKRQELLCT